MGKSLEEEGGKLQAEQVMLFGFTFLFFFILLEVIEKHITTSFVKQLLWRRVKWLLQEEELATIGQGLMIDSHLESV